MGTQTRGRPFLQIPGPTNIPDRVLRAMDRAVIDHRGPEFAAVRAAIDAAGSDALLIVDTVSSLGSMDFRFDEWRVDVALTGSQKGLMLPPGLAILCIGSRALAAGERGGSPRSFFDWRPIIRENEAGFFPYTPATLVLFGLREAAEEALLGRERVAT